MDTFFSMSLWNVMNLQQADYEEKHKLIKFNEKIASPYHSGLGLKFLESYIGKENFQNALKQYFKSISSKHTTLSESVKKFTDKEIDWLFDDYFKRRNAYDLKIEKAIVDENRVSVLVSEKNNRSIPFTLGLLKKDSLVHNEWIAFKGNDTLLTVDKKQADFVAINPTLSFPEFNRKNNWKNLRNKWQLKPLKLNFFTDLEDPQNGQLFYNPTFGFNSYDGLNMGISLYNDYYKAKPFEFNLTPLYGMRSRKPVGNFLTTLNFRQEDKKNYLTSFYLFGSSYHYDTNLRYSVLTPQLYFFYRTPDFRSNERQILNFSWYFVERQRAAQSANTTKPNYSLLNASHTYTNENAVQYLTTNTAVEASSSFGKFYFTLNYRKLFPSGRQFSARFFGGKFLWHNQMNTTFFDFNLNNPTDYLFQYNYLGRSDETGFFSQQFINGEGAFKSKFQQPTANDYLMAVNMSMGLWKWVELYADVGLAKNKGQQLRTPSDVGIRLNLVPDYLELFFPIASNNGWEINQAQYSTRIRFILSLNPETLSQLFIRKWF